MSSVSGALTTTATAKWGTACAACAGAKSRCIRSNGTVGKCDRCQILQKDCTGQIHKKRKKRQAKPSRTALLEEKLDSLVDLLKSTPGGTTTAIDTITSTSPTPPSKSTESESTPKISITTPKQSQPFDNEIIHNDFPSKFSSIAPPTCICRASVNPEDSLPADIDPVLLSIYTTHLLPWFPFIPLPASTTPTSLQHTRPVLLKAIRLVSSLRNIRSMWGQRRAVMQYLSSAVFVRSERSLDLLQGILVLLGFYHYHCLVHIQFNNLMQLAVSIVGDMDLNRDPGRGPKVKAMAEERDGDGEETRVRSQDERRAVLGVWYMSSNVALTFNKGQSDKFTKYHEQCLEELEIFAEYDSDILLVQIVRIQHLTQKIVDFNNRDQLPDVLPGIVEMPASAYHAAFMTELERLREGVNPSLRENYLLTNHLNTLHLRLYEPLLQDSSLLDAVSRSLTTLSLTSLPPHSRDRFIACHIALKTWFDHWLTIPVCHYFYMSQPLAAQLMVGIMMLSRWALLFSSSSVRSGSLLASSSGSAGGEGEGGFGEQIDVLDILDKTATRFEAAKLEMSAAQGGVWRNGIWDLAARKVRLKRRRVEGWWGAVERGGGRGRFRFGDSEEEDGSSESGVEVRSVIGGGNGVGGNEVGGEDGAGGWYDGGGGVGDESWLWADLFDGMDGGIDLGMDGIFDIPPAIS
ncbi:hypothetical protein BKA65DRAFT_561029 [Rhexocercosporidium sp. MPI-PUGE-AT-0058]|nr:hypothetical protein BKA65DRAFT_561029 [Rhexocercosporidium sp. MPI-PUGE-AT-0058]